LPPGSPRIERRRVQACHLGSLLAAEAPPLHGADPPWSDRRHRQAPSKAQPTPPMDVAPGKGEGRCAENLAACNANRLRRKESAFRRPTLRGRVANRLRFRRPPPATRSHAPGVFARARFCFSRKAEAPTPAALSRHHVRRGTTRRPCGCHPNSCGM
jgi:hypothetical protein